MNSGKNLYKKNDNNNKEKNFLNKKKNREINEEPMINQQENEINNIQNQNEKYEINQNMFNQYNFYQGFPPIELQLQQLNNQNINNPEYYQNVYYIANPYTYFPNGQELGYYTPEVEEEGPFTDLKGHINNLYKRGIVNNIIGAFYIEEIMKNRDINDDEETINNKNVQKKAERDKYHNLNYEKNSELELNKENINLKNEIKN